MTAQIIQFPVKQPAQAPRKTSHRGLHLTDNARDVLARINRGEVITDIGQIDDATKRMLKKMIAKGWVFEGRDYTFPKVKRCWCGTGLTLGDIPPNITFSAVTMERWERQGA